MITAPWRRLPPAQSLSPISISTPPNPARPDLKKPRHRNAINRGKLPAKTVRMGKPGQFRRHRAVHSHSDQPSRHHHPLPGHPFLRRQSTIPLENLPEIPGTKPQFPAPPLHPVTLFVGKPLQTVMQNMTESQNTPTAFHSRNSHQRGWENSLQSSRSPSGKTALVVSFQLLVQGQQHLTENASAPSSSTTRTGCSSAASTPVGAVRSRMTLTTRMLMWVLPSCQLVRSMANTQPPEGLAARATDPPRRKRTGGEEPLETPVNRLGLCGGVGDGGQAGRAKRWLPDDRQNQHQKSRSGGNGAQISRISQD